MRGDAIAGLIIIVHQHHRRHHHRGRCSTACASPRRPQTYTLLTVGDGLVSQIPALIVSIAAGLLVSKAGVEGSADKALVGQLAAIPTALGMVVGRCWACSRCCPACRSCRSWRSPAAPASRPATCQERERREGQRPQSTAGRGRRRRRPRSRSATAWRSTCQDRARLGLLPLINGRRAAAGSPTRSRRCAASSPPRSASSCRRCASWTTCSLPPNGYVVRIKEMEAGRGEIRPNHAAGHGPARRPIELPGEHDPSRPSACPPPGSSEACARRRLPGYTIVDPPHRAHHAPDRGAQGQHGRPALLRRDAEAAGRAAGASSRSWSADLIPAQIIGRRASSACCRPCCGERVSIRDLPTILEGIAEACGYTRNITAITEHVRARLARQICGSQHRRGGYLPLITLSPEWEQAFAEAMVGHGDDRQLAMAPSRLQEFITTVRQTFERHAMRRDARCC